MAVAAHMLLLLVSFLLPFSSVSLESPQPALEEGYTISTILDGNKLQEPIHPYALQRREEAGGRSTLLVLDSAASSFFELQLPLSQDGLVRRVAGDGVAGYSDGAGDASRFAHPRSFAVDGKGNVYVADRTSHVIRKIDAQGLGGTYLSLIAILCLLIGIVIGLLVRSFIFRTGNTQPQVRHDMEALPSSSGGDLTDSLLRHQKRNC